MTSVGLQEEENLLKNRWFDSLPAELRTSILDSSTITVCESGQVISEEDARPSGLYAILEGQVAITRRVGANNVFFFNLGGPGFWFGGVGRLQNITSIVTVTARTPVRLLYLSIAKFRKIVADEPCHYERFAEFIMERFTLVIDCLAQTHGLPAEEQLRVRLADISDLSQLDGVVADPVELSVTQLDLAQMIGCSRQTMNALLKNLESEKLIDVGFRKVIIRDPKGLRGDSSGSGI